MADRSVKVTLGADVSPLKSAMNDAARSVDQVSASADRMGGSVKGGLASLKSTMDSTLRGIGSVELVIGGLYASAMKTGIGFNALQQSSRAALTAIMGSAEAANAQMDKLFEFTATSPLPKEAYIQAQQTLLSFGVSAEKVIPILKAIDDTTIAIGGNAETVGQLTLVMGQIQSQGKITGRELMRLGMAGVDAAQMIGTQMGLTAQEVRDKISKSAIDADTALTALAAGMEAKFGGASEMVKQQFQGATDRMRAAWRDLGGELAKPLVDPVSGGKLVTWLNDTADIIRAMTPHVVELQTAFAGAFGASGIHTGLQGIVTWLKQLDPAQVQSFAKRMGDLAPIISAVSAASLTMATSNLPVIGGFMKAIGPLPAALAAAALASPQLRQALMDLLSAAAPLVEAAGKLAGSLLEMGQSVIEAGADLLTSLVPAVSTLATMLTPLVELVAGAVHAFDSLPGPIKMFTAALLAASILDGPFTKMFASIGGGLSGMRTQMSVAEGAFGKFSAAGTGAARSVAAAFGGPWTIAIAGAVTGIGLFIEAADKGKPKVRDFTDVVDANTGALADNADAQIKAAAAEDLAQWTKLGGDADIYTQALLGSREALVQMPDQIRKVTLVALEQSSAWKNNAATFQAAGISAQDVATAFSQSADGSSDAWSRLVEKAVNAGHIQSGSMTQLMVAMRQVQDTYGQYELNIESVNKAQEESAEKHKITGDAIRNGAQAAQDSYVAWLQARSAIGAAGDVAATTASEVDGLSDAVAGQIGVLQALLGAAQQARSQLSGAITGMVNPVGAYEAAQQKANAKPSGGGGGGGGSKSMANPLVDAATKLADAAKKDRDAIDQRYKDILSVTKARYDEQLAAWEKARDAVKAAADEAQRYAESFLSNAKDRASAAKDEATALADLAGFGSQGSTLASALESQAVAQAKLNVARAEQVKIEKQLASTGLSAKDRAQLQDRLNTLIAQQSSLQAVAAAADKNAAQARADLAANVDLSTTASVKAIAAMQQQAQTAAEVIGKDQEAAQVAANSSATKQKADDDYASHKSATDAALKALQTQADAANKAATDKYNKLLDEKNAMEEKSKASSASHGGGVSGAAAKMAADAAPSFNQYMAELKKQVTAQENWKNNIIDLASRVGPGVAAELAKMGPQAAPMVEMLVKQSDTELQKWAPLFMKSTAAGTQAILDELTKALDPTGKMGLQLGDSVISNLLDEIKSAKNDDDAKAAIQHVLDIMQRQANSRPLRVTTQVSTTTGEKIFVSGAGTKGMAKGGWIPGAAHGEWISGGTPGKDSVLRWLMPGEAVIPTASAQANRPLIDALIAGKNVAGASSGRVDLMVTIRGGDALTEEMVSTADVRIEAHQQGQNRLNVTLSRARGKR